MQDSILVGIALRSQQRRVIRYLDPRAAGEPFVAQIAVEVEGPLDSDRLQAALEAVVKRHEILRTRFVLRPGFDAQLQVVLPDGAVPSASVRLLPLDRMEDGAYHNSRFAAVPDDAFEIESGNLIHATLSRDVERDVLTLTVPAICADPVSLTTVVRDLARAYSSPNEASEPVVQYGDTVEYFENILASDFGVAGRQYWHALIIGAGESRLRQRAGGEGPVRFRPAVVSRRVAASRLQHATVRAHYPDASIEYFLLACWQVLLFRLNRREKLVIGYAANGRATPDLDGCVGLFEIYIPVQFTGSPEQTFAELMGAVMEGAQEGGEWQAAFRWPDEDGFHFVAFSYYDVDWSFGGQDLRFRCAGMRACTDRYCLKLSCAKRANEVDIDLWYDSSVYTEPEIELLASQLMTLIEEAGEHPDVALRGLNLIGEGERRELVEGRNRTAFAFGETSLESRVALQAAGAPDLVALEHGAGCVTYAELNRRANALACRLRRDGAQPETRVAFCLNRSVEAVVAMLAILKTGAAYVPMEPAHPTQRLAGILEDVDAQIVLTDKALVDRFPGGQARVICMPGDWEALDCDGEEVITEAQPDNAAYVLYTSGSTGRPKGVVISRGGLMNYLDWAAGSYRFALGMRAPLHSSLTVDLTVTSVWLPLLSGGSVVILDEETGLAAVAGQRSLSDVYGMVKLTPSHLRMLETLAGSCMHATLTRGFIIGGEALTWHDIAYWREKAPLTKLVNEYGPTETVVGCCAYEAPAEGSFTGPVPIGRPITNVRVYVLDEWLCLAPTGMVGELYIGGAGVARGYWKRPNLTADAFVPDELSGQLGARLYRTGDQVRWRADGELEYVGRLDHQVKLRGFRIELGEIEAALLQHPEVAQCAVAVREHDAGDRGLIAYYVPCGATVPAAAKMRQYLAVRLPESMVPSTFLIIPQLPLTPGGKLDRNALPAPPAGEAPREQGETAKTPTEEIVAGIWGEVLRRDQVGRDENFFELGGHSLMATQVVSRIKETLGVDLGLRRIFENPTVAALARTIEASRRRVSQGEIAPIERALREGDLPLSYAQQRLWFIQQLDPESSAYNVPTAVRLEGTLDIPGLRRSLQELMERHETLRTTFELRDDRAVQVIDQMAKVGLAVYDLSAFEVGEREDRARQLATEELLRPFDLARGPVWRASLIRLGPEDHLLLLCIHHIACDGWSMRIVVKELTAMYETGKAGRKADLPSLPIQYADFAVWQRNWLVQEVMDRQLEYWRRQLAGMREFDLPTDRPRAATPSHRASYVDFNISPESVGALKALSRQEGATLFMTLLAGFYVLLGWYTRRDDVWVGTDVANRSRRETEGLIGFFVNQVVLRVNLAGNATFRELLSRVRETTLDAYTHHDLPFDKLVEDLQPDRGPGKTPLFQTLFVLDPVEAEETRLEDLVVRRYPFDSGQVKFQWVLLLQEMNGRLAGTWRYRSDLFHESSMQRACRRFQALVEKVAAAPDTSLPELQRLLDEADRYGGGRSRARLFAMRQPKTVKLSSDNLVNLMNLSPGQSFPIVVKPAIDDFDAIEWARTERQFIDDKLLQHGAMLLRNFRLDGPAAFESFVGAISPDLFAEYGDLPREQYSGRVYGSTPYPSDQAIPFHNESCHMHCWPLKIWFYCVTPPQRDGQTPVVDCRVLYREMDPAMRQKFVDKGLMYVRNFSDGLDVSWQDFFRTSDPAAVEEFCQKAGILCEWDNKKTLRTTRHCPAVATHPKTGARVFFNQIQAHHVSCLDPALRQSLLDLFGEQGLPRNVYYGDGEAIPDSVVDELKGLCEKHACSFDWQQGDILMVDNMLAAHSRRPFVGPRRILVAMGEMIGISGQPGLAGMASE